MTPEFKQFIGIIENLKTEGRLDSLLLNIIKSTKAFGRFGHQSSPDMLEQFRLNGNPIIVKFGVRE